MNNLQFGFLPVWSVLNVDEDLIQRTIVNYEHFLIELGGERCKMQQVTDHALFTFFVVTGGTENIILKLYSERIEHFQNEAVFLIAHPGNNSLAACLELMARFQQDDIRGRIFYLDGPDDKEGFQQIKIAFLDEIVSRSLCKVRIGLLGSPSDWLVASKSVPKQVQLKWGPEIIPIKMNEVKQELKNVQKNAIENYMESLTENAVEIREPSREEIEDAVRIYLALKQIIQRHQLDAFSLRCFDIIKDLKTSGCFALSQFLDEGIIAGCEGDIISTVAMIWTQKLLNEIPLDGKSC